MRRLLLAMLLGCISLLITGCGGCGEMSQADMKARAIRRQKDDETPPPPKKKTRVVKQDDEQKKPVKPPVVAKKDDPPKTPTPDPKTPKVDAPGVEPVKPTPPAAVASPKPDKPLTIAERRKLTIEHMKSISAALHQHLKAKGGFPAFAKFDPSGKVPLLSWRVMLLPYMGHESLFDQFHLDEPWDSPHNSELISQMPDVYRSPERFDEKTNYLYAVDGPSVFSSRSERIRGPQAIEDGLSNTIILLEVADDHAVPWTQPQDFDLVKNKIEEQLGKLREDGMFVVWGDGRLGLLPTETGAGALLTFFTPDAGDNTTPAMAFSPTPPIEPPTTTADATGSVPGSLPSTGLEVVDPLAPPPGSTADPTMPAAGAVATPAVTPPGTGVTPPGKRLPVPDSVALNKAQVLLEEIYRERIDAARNREQKSQVARSLLADLPRLQQDPGGQYVLLEGVRKMALEAGDAVIALQAVEELGRRFEVDATSMRIEAVSEFARSGSFQNQAANEIVLNYAAGLLRQALAEDNFDAAQKMYDIAITAARRVQNSQLVRQLQEHKQEIDVARAAYAQVENVLDQLGVDPYAPGPNLIVGKYYCFVKGDWSRGLPLLARGDDDELRALAEMELDPPALADKQVELADRWWNVGDDHPMPLRRQMQLRGVSWYQKAHAQLPEGLRKVKVEVRLKEAQRTYGRAVEVPSPKPNLAGPRPRPR
ncbi:MAG: DUF1559 domain-containing protein [Pirellulaceae bacterium]